MQLFTRKSALASTFTLIGMSLFAQVDVDVNLNMKHSVDGESRFGRERRMTIHSSLPEGDWTGHEDKLNYLINDLDVYFGRETGSATWKMHYVEEDPNKPGWANEEQMAVHGNGLKQWYESEDFADRHQYEGKSHMIMGVNDHTPMYPNLSWHPGFGKGAGGWFVKDTDAAADWVAKYLANYYAQTPGQIGEKLPTYWEIYNEPDMNYMNPSFGMIVSSMEKNWEYHKLVAQEVRAKLGANAPKIGGMCLGQLDFYKQDGIPSRTDGQFWYDNSSAEANLLYDNMLSGVGSGIPNPGVGKAVWPKAWENRTKDWWQWDYMYQGFIDYTGADMDFYGVHLYDWPQEDPQRDKANTRSGGHVEAMLDLMEWYDNELFGQKKDIIMSEFGTVNSGMINKPAWRDGKRDWLYIKPFNQMMMQFLERPSHVVYSMPFAPVKAVWGAHFEGNNVVRYDGATLMEPKGSWTGDSSTWTMNEPTGGWEWSGIIHFFELWKDVEGTRIDTKASDIDVQVDAYVNGKHVYVILNNAIDDNKSINLNTFGLAGNNIENVELRHIFKGDAGYTQYTVANMTAAPAQVTLKPNSTIVLDYTFANNVVIDQESEETKYMSAPLAGNAKNDRGTQLCHTASTPSITATVSGVVKPAHGEAIIRVGGFFPNPNDGNPGMKIKKLTVNGNDVIVQADNFIANTRGYGLGNFKGAWFGVLELECPIEYLQDGNNTVTFERYQAAEFTTLMIQVFDMTTDPGRTNGGSTITGLAFNSATEDVMNGETLGLAPIFTSEDASDKGLTWTSSNEAVATVDENGVVTAVADSGSTVITATSTADNSIAATITINAMPYQASTVTAISIIEGDALTVAHYTNTDLNIEFTPTPTVAPEVEWTTSDDSVVEIVSNGTIIGKKVGETATITATVKGTTIKDDIVVTVGIAGQETIFCDALPTNFDATTNIDFTANVNIDGARELYIALVKGADVLASNTINLNAQGLETVPVSFTLANAPAPGTGYKLRAELTNGTTIISTCDNDITINQPTTITSVTVSPSSAYAVTSDAIQLSAKVLPADASNKTVNWTTSNANIATVDANGLVTAISSGTVTITATAVDGGLQDSSVITFVDPSSSLIIEAEDLTSTSGTEDDSSWGGPGFGFRVNGEWIDYGNTGDWAEYQVNIPESGFYQVTYHYATPGSNTEITGTINGTDFSTDTFESTGEWTTPGTHIACAPLQVNAGTQTFKVTATGADVWQWNLDKIELIKVPSDYAANMPCGGHLSVDEVQTNAISFYPNPASDVLNITNLKGDEKISLYDFTGRFIGKLEASGTINISHIPSGVYLIHIVGNQTTFSKTLIVNRN
ncbi:Ig-like domain-containing protein [Tamlana sp. s12]|uniref:Ig-like domain-containing protein n=1 Tax=Tamlana sp. s12 TaxID=1630406 RepID=UPI0009EECA16|nr:Ig-like domain-containing protein [Tamlana sp. s12]QQY82005.1 Ig-like domain-containing protein [Tamlana sp. s12]